MSLLSSSQYRQTRYLSSPVDVWSPTSFLHCVIPFLSAPIASSEVFGDVCTRGFDGIVCWLVAVAGHDVSIVIALTNITHYTMNSVFLWCASEYFCSSLSSTVFDFVAKFVGRFFCCVLVLPLCYSRRWRQCIVVDWYGVLYSVFIFRNSRWRNFYYLNDSGTWQGFRSWSSLYCCCADLVPFSASWRIVAMQGGSFDFSAYRDVFAVASVGKVVRLLKVVGPGGRGGVIKRGWMVLSSSIYALERNKSTSKATRICPSLSDFQPCNVLVVQLYFFEA